MAKWSKIWETHSGKARELRLDDARYTPPLPREAGKQHGKYPHLQPFFKNRKEELKKAA